MKQIVGGTLSDSSAGLRTNFVSEYSSAHYAAMYRRDGIAGGHVIKLGQGNDAAAREALAAYPGGLHIGGGITAENAREWLDAGASHVIVTSWLFPEGDLAWDRLRQLETLIGRERLVVDLSCRIRDGRYWVVTNRWQTFTTFEVNAASFEKLEAHCAEFLIHAVDVEGLCRGVDLNLVQRLAEWCRLPMTYAGGASSLRDLEQVTELSGNRVDLTIGSALDIFGGTGVSYADCVKFNQAHPSPNTRA